MLQPAPVIFMFIYVDTSRTKMHLTTLLSLIDEPVRLLNGGRFFRQVRLLWSGWFNRK